MYLLFKTITDITGPVAGMDLSYSDGAIVDNAANV